ncbi:hypothetical protein NLG97_g7777 [Lecanicillium saksenae]|uniref:Uncharacterized protein n=1 Tax=Lecanicillium saksenae TaxID=468837 RepID=A0ACC1QKX8_9HYPO|nr:hypothetical protein NLG97_g7777 [Lecanicillium saksenae]
MDQLFPRALERGRKAEEANHLGRLGQDAPRRAAAQAHKRPPHRVLEKLVELAKVAPHHPEHHPGAVQEGADAVPGPVGEVGVPRYVLGGQAIAAHQRRQLPQVRDRRAVGLPGAREPRDRGQELGVGGGHVEAEGAGDRVPVEHPLDLVADAYDGVVGVRGAVTVETDDEGEPDQVRLGWDLDRARGVDDARFVLNLHDIRVR